MDRTSKRTPSPGHIDFAAARNRREILSRRTSMALLLSCAAWPAPVLAGSPAQPAALPTGEHVVAGKATFDRSGHALTVHQGSDRLIANWDSFSIGTGSEVTFVQPGASSVALNRVIGQSPTQILGKLSANGQVFLINPNGIVFGKGSQVNVGALAASTLGIADADFLTGKYRFTGKGGAITNQGALNGKVIALIAPTVTNEGTIRGDAALAAGSDVSLDFDGDGLISVDVSKSTVRTLVENKGLIAAGGGKVVLTAKGASKALAGVVNNSGTIEAHTIAKRGGHILLLGHKDNGTVNVGGKLDASAPNGGDGGSIETSAATVKVADDATITTAAPHGKTGSWLVDPLDYVIAASGGDITGQALSAALANNSVTFRSDAGAGSGNGDVLVNDAVHWDANTLTLHAANNVIVNAPLTVTGNGGLALEYGEITSGDFTVSSHINLASSAHFSTEAINNGVTIQYTIVNNADDLQAMAGDPTGHYVLGSDIDAGATASSNGGLGFAPIGALGNGNMFTGIFDGLGHVISNLTIDRPDSDYIGLFGYIGNARIRNVGLTGGSITGRDFVGGLAGYDTGAITNVSSANGVIGRANIGGLIGAAVGGDIGNASASGRVQSVLESSSNIGGLIGSLTAGAALHDSFATGDVNGYATVGGVGGLVGYADASSVSNVYAAGLVGVSYYTGAVAGTRTAVGGLIGENDRTALSDVHADGDVHYSVANAGLTAFVGGLVGQNQGSSVLHSYATGDVVTIGDSIHGVGGLIGRNDSNSAAFATTGQVGWDYATGNVKATIGSNAGSDPDTAYGVGGLIGIDVNTDALATTGDIHDSYATGNVLGVGDLGGLIGINYAGLIRYTYATSTLGVTNGTVVAGGLVGMSGGTIDNSYATGKLNVVGSGGGLVGYMILSSGKITASYWDTDTTGQASALGGQTLPQDSAATGLTTAKALQKASYADFDPTHWFTMDGALPMLNAQYSTTITNAAQLQLMAMNLDADYTLANDIDMSGAAGWNLGMGFTPIGAPGGGHMFTGSLDGQGHVISNLTINRPDSDYVGLFGYIGNAVIKDVGLSGSTIVGGSGIGGIGSFAGYNKGTLTGVYSDSGVIATGGHVGDLIGRNEGTLRETHADGDVSVSGGYGTDAGGLVGYNTGWIETSYSTGTVTVNNTSNYAGGLAGYSEGTIINSYSTGTVTGRGELGGLVGYDEGEITNSYFAGSVSANGPADIGGLVGTFNPLPSNKITNSYWNNDSPDLSSGIGNDQSGGAAVAHGLSSAQMRDVANFTGWDFDMVWAFNGQLNNGFPILRVFGDAPTVHDLVITLGGLGMVYGDALPTLGGYTVSGCSGCIAGIDWGSLITGGKLDAGFYGYANNGVLTYDFSSGSAADYAITFASPTGLTVDRRPVTLSGSFTAMDKVYDGNRVAQVDLGGLALSGTLTGDDVALNLAGATGSFVDKNVGNGKTVTLDTAGALTGADVGNYVFTSAAPTALANITPATISAITGITADDKTYDGTTAATLETGNAAFTGIVAGDHLAVTGGVGTFADKNAGSGKTVTITGLGLGGADAGNYRLATMDASTTADIARASVSLAGSFTAQDKSYDGTTAATVDASGVSLSNVIGGDAVALDVADATATFANPDPGIGKTVTISGLSLTGADAGNYTLLNGSATATATIKSNAVVGEPPMYPSQLLVGYIPGFDQPVATILSSGSDLIEIVHQAVCAQNTQCTGEGNP